MIQRGDEPHENDDARYDTSDDDERVGEAIETYLALAEQGQPPAIEEFAARYPDLVDDVRSALEGLELVHGLLGLRSAGSSASGHGSAWDHRIETGQRIAGYRVVRELGRGGMGTVYEAVHMGLDRPVALKVLGVHATPDSSARRRFLNEARTAAGLHHTHIVPVFDVGQMGGLCYYAMQRIEGSGLDRVVRHLRRTRVAGSAGLSGTGPAAQGVRGGYDDQHAASSGSSTGSRLTRLWNKVATTWRSRKPETVFHGHGTAHAPGHGLPSALHADTVSRLLSLSGLTDSTASWDANGRRVREPQGDLVTTGHPATISQLGAVDRMPRRDDDEPPPFETPRGSAYFRWVATVGYQAAEALAHAHQQGVIHRDVKPSNLLVDAKGSIWVTDFGLARRLADPGQTHHDSLLGTPRYMSPEQARTGSIDGRTDVYSLGATLYELLTLRPPFDGKSAAELLDQIGQDEPAHPRAIDPRIPLDVETIVLKALAKRPADRYKTATELAEDLTRYLNHEPVKARRISPIGRLWRVARRHPGITSVSTAAAIAILSIATFAYVRVLAARDLASNGQKIAEAALEEARIANLQTNSEIKERLVKQVELLEKSDFPDRRRQGLELITETVSRDPDPAQRSTLRDLAMKFQVLRQVESHDSDLATGRAHGLAFGMRGRRLAVLSEDQEELAFWDVGRRQLLSTLPLRGDNGATLGPIMTRPAPDSGGEGVQSTVTVPAFGLNAGRSGSSGTAVPVRSPLFDPRRLAPTAQYLAALLADNTGVRLIDMSTGATLRVLHRPDRAQVLSVLADPGGQRLITIERVTPDEMTAIFEQTYDLETPGEFQVNLWDPDNLEKEKPRNLAWTMPPNRNRPNSAQPVPPPPRPSVPPLVAISPDGKTVAIAAVRGGLVRLFSGEDGRPIGRGPIETQPELTAIALGPNSMLATAGGGIVRLWNLDRESRTALTELMPAQNFTRKLQFSPQGNLLAIAGLGPVELWDPVAHALVGVLKTKTSEQINDLAFAPDGETLAVVDRAGVTSLWTVTDSAIRTQLSGIDARPSSLAFNNEGVLAGGGWNGTVWFWRQGRCPEVSAPLPLSSPNRDEPSPGPGRTGPPAPSPGAAITRGPTSPTAGPPAAPSPAGGSNALDPARQNGPGSRGGRGGSSRVGPRDGGDPRPSMLAFDAQGRLIVHDMKGLRIWAPGSLSALTPPALTSPLPAPAKRPWFNLMAVARTTDARTMVFVRSSTVFLWHDDSTGKVIPVIPPPHTEATSVAMSGLQRAVPGGVDSPAPIFHAVRIAPRGDRIYLIDQNGRLHVWALEPATESNTDVAEVRAHELDWSIPVAEGGFSNLALRADGAVLALGDHTQTVTLIDTVNHAMLGQIKPTGGEAESPWLALQFAPGGRDLAVGSEQGIISVWSIAQPSRPRLRFRLPGHRGMTSSLAFDAQGRRLASAGMDPLVEVWDLELIQQELAQLHLAD